MGGADLRVTIFLCTFAWNKRHSTQSLKTILRLFIVRWATFFNDTVDGHWGEIDKISKYNI